MATKKAIPVKKNALSTNHIISKENGSKMVGKFQEAISKLGGTINFEKGKEFNRSVFESLLKLKGCTTIRIYNAVDDYGNHTFVITAVNNKQNDIYFKMPRTKAADNALTTLPPDEDGVANMGNSCPVYKKSVISLP